MSFRHPLLADCLSGVARVLYLARNIEMCLTGTLDVEYVEDWFSFATMKSPFKPSSKRASLESESQGFEINHIAETNYRIIVSAAP